MELILWRHAEAEENPEDDARELTGKGKKQARKIAKWLSKRVEKPVRVVASPAVRAQQTAAAYDSDFETDPAVGVGAKARAILAAAGWPDAEGTVIVVGHQPALGKLAALLITGKETDWNIKKGTVWWFSARGNGGDTEVVLRAVMSPNQV